MMLQIPLADVRGCTKMLHEALLQIEGSLSIGDCRLHSCQVKYTKLHQLVLIITSLAGIKFYYNEH